MSQSIPAQATTNEIALDSAFIKYTPTWDGANWVVALADVTIQTRTKLVNGSNDFGVVHWDIPALDLDASGQTALTDLLASIELEIVSKY